MTRDTDVLLKTPFFSVQGSYDAHRPRGREHGSGSHRRGGGGGGVAAWPCAIAIDAVEGVHNKSSILSSANANDGRKLRGKRRRMRVGAVAIASDDNGGVTKDRQSLPLQGTLCYQQQRHTHAHQSSTTTNN
jgi:hypothetical protein